MVKRCCVPLCRNNGRRTNKVSWHAFPQNPDIRKQWITNIRRDAMKYPISRNSRVCGAHFTPSDFKPLLHTNRKYLKPNAVPTIFKWTSNEAKSSGSTTKAKVPVQTHSKKRQGITKECTKEVNEAEKTGLYGVECTSFESPLKMKFTAKKTDANDVTEDGSMQSTVQAFSNGGLMSGLQILRIQTADEKELNGSAQGYVLLRSAENPVQEKNAYLASLLRDNLEPTYFDGIQESIVTKEPSGNSSKKVNAAVQCALHLIPSSQMITETPQTRSAEVTSSPQHFSIVNIKKDPEYLELYSNFPGLEHFSSCFSLVKSMNNFEKPESSLSLEDEFFLTVVRLTLGVPVFDLSYRFAINRQSASRIFMKWLSGMYKAFKQIIIWPTKDVVKKFMPAVFQRHFPTTRCLVSIIEIPTERQLATHSESTPHSNRSTLKALIAMTPSGCLSFASEPISGTCSDSELFLDCGILNKLERGDSIMAPARLYTQIKVICELRGISIYPLASASKVRRTVVDDQDGPMCAVVSLKICEREVERILKYRILEFVPNALCCTGLINKIFYVCAFLTNYYPPLVSETPVGS